LTRRPGGNDATVKVVVVLNTRSRRTSASLAIVRDAIAKSNLDVRGFYEVADEDEARKRIKRAVRDRMDAVIVGGGDGTIANAVNVLAHRSTILGVIPLGTGNSFAQTIGLAPDDIPAAIATILERRAVHVDLGQVDTTYFANFATIGLPAEIGERTPRGLKRFFGKFAYVASAIGPILTHGAFRAKIRWPGGKLTVRTQQIVVASGRLFGPKPLTPEASIVDGKLALFTPEGGSQATVVATYLAMALGQQTRLPGAHALSAKEFVVRAKPKQPIAIDGDAYGTTPARFRVAPGALYVFVPKTFVEANDARA
jgi:YegS/Rv2252/BmrU family lipid kinase